MRSGGAGGNVILPAMKRKPIQVHHFTLRDGHIELHNLLKIVGVADSGGQGKALVAAGAVQVDDVPEARKTAKIRAGQKVTLDGVTIHVHAPDNGVASAG